MSSMATTCINLRQHSSSSSSSISSYQLQIHCCANSKPRPPAGFGPQKPTKNDPKADEVTSTSKGKGVVLPKRKSTSQQPGSLRNRAPGLSLQTDGKSKGITPLDLQFEERLQAIKRSALDQKKEAGKKEYGAIDYDEPVTSERSTIGTGTKIGVGVAVVVFGFVFALGDFLPSGRVSPTEETTAVNNEISSEAKANLQTRLQQFEAALNISPADPTALEGAAVTLAELGEYKRAASLLEELTKKKPSDPDAFRLLGEVKYELKDYEGSAAAFRTSAMVSKTIDFEVLRGLTNALLNAEKPNEAVQVLMEYRERLKTERSDGGNVGAATEAKSGVDPIQVELLLGKAYSDWGHVSDAVSIYDQLISSHPDDFRGYLAKGIILKENGKLGDAERMFIQARFFAPEKARALVERYSRQ